MKTVILIFEHYYIYIQTARSLWIIRSNGRKKITPSSVKKHIKKLKDDLNDIVNSRKLYTSHMYQLSRDLKMDKKYKTISIPSGLYKFLETSYNL